MSRTNHRDDDDVVVAHPTAATTHHHGQQRLGLRMGQTAAGKAFRALRQLRPDRAYGLLNTVGHSRTLNPAVLSRLEKANQSATTPTGASTHGQVRGRKRQAAKRALRAAYHGMLSMTVLPLAYVVAAAFPEGHAGASRSTTLHSLANAPSNALSRWFGYFAGTRRLPPSVHHRMIRMMVRVYGIDISQVEQPIEAYPTMQDFFSRRLVAGARPPHPSAILVSPCDGEVLRVGRMTGDGSDVIVQVKGNEYPVEQLIAAPMPPVENGFTRWFYLFHLRPKDYHRFHAPCDAQVLEAIHVPGCLFPVTQTAAKWIPNLFAESERVAVLGRRADGQPLAFVPMGATCVGSISLGFDPTLKTNSISSLTNLRSLFQWRPWGSHKNHPEARVAAETEEDAAQRERVPLLGAGWEYATTKQAGALVTSSGESGDAVSFVSSPWTASPATPAALCIGDSATSAAASSSWPSSPTPAVFTATSNLAACPVQRYSHFAAGSVQRRVYPTDCQPQVQRGLEMGWFNWGSAILMVTDLPDDVVPCVRDHEEVRVGQALCAPVGSDLALRSTA